MDSLPSTPESVRSIRVFASSPGDVRKERALVDEIAESINRAGGEAHGFRLDLY